MKGRWSRREIIVKSLIATGGAVAAKLSGVVPELRWVAPAAASPDQAQPPPYMQKAVRQDEVKGPDAQALLAAVSASADVREVLGQLSLPAVDLQALGAHAVRSVLGDGQVVVAVSAVLADQEHVLAHYQFGAGPRTAAFVYRVTADRKVDFAAGSADGRAIRRMTEPSNLPANAVLANGCPSCTYSCEVCCGYDWWGILECCSFCAALWECPPCFLACALTWCSACVWFHCYHCWVCCQDWWCF